MKKKLLKTQEKNIHEMQGTNKRSNLQLINVNKGEEPQVKGIDKIFNKIMEENFSKLRKGTLIQIQEKHLTPNEQDQKRKFLQHITVKFSSIQNKERILKASEIIHKSQNQEKLIE